MFLKGNKDAFLPFLGSKIIHESSITFVEILGISEFSIWICFSVVWMHVYWVQIPDNVLKNKNISSHTWVMENKELIV